MPLIKQLNQKLTKIRTPRDTDLAGGIFNFNFFLGSQGIGPDSNIFTTTRRFVADDYSLMVFKNGQYRYQNIHYLALDNQNIQFIESLSPTDEIAIIVNGGSIVRDNSANNFNNIVQLAGDLYKTGSAQLFNTGVKALENPVSFQGLLSPVKAVVGPNGTHDRLQDAIDFVSEGALIMIDSHELILTEAININKDNITIMGCGRGSVISGDGSFIGFNITNDGVKIKGLKFNNFSTAIKVSSESCMVIENYFTNNTIDVDYSGIVKLILENNLKE